MTKKRANLASIGEELRDAALCYPDTDEHFPWGETAIKVRGKTFLFMRADSDALSFSLSCRTRATTR